jgi:hypothetical protein
MWETDGLEPSLEEGKVQLLQVSKDTCSPHRPGSSCQPHCRVLLQIKLCFQLPWLASMTDVTGIGRIELDIASYPLGEEV